MSFSARPLSQPTPCASDAHLSPRAGRVAAAAGGPWASRRVPRVPSSSEALLLAEASSCHRCRPSSLAASPICGACCAWSGRGRGAGAQRRRAAAWPLASPSTISSALPPLSLCRHGAHRRARHHPQRHLRRLLPCRARRCVGGESRWPQGKERPWLRRCRRRRRSHGRSPCLLCCPFVARLVFFWQWWCGS